MLTTAPSPAETAREKPPAANESRADGKNLKLAENNGKRGGSTRGESSPSSVNRFFLSKKGSNGIPELDLEVEDENTAMVEALKTGRSFIILSEWRPTVDNTTKGRPVITKEAVSVSKSK